MLVILSPLFLLISGLIFLEDGASPFYYQTRVGKGNKLFSVLKFRSMKVNAESATGPTLSYIGDDRVTKIGRFLRALHLDELPQLVNVLKGDMDFIGPRPERPCFVNKYCEEIPSYAERSMVRPGITGLAQVMLPYGASAREKLDFDRFYIKYHNSIVLKVMVLFLTMLKMMQMPFFSEKMNKFINEAANG
jgi:lipopolysaccharide/colanic/teichoic acid biosynthesis glycosyltransferase